MSFHDLLATAQQRPLTDAELIDFNEMATGLSQYLGMRFTAVTPTSIRSELVVSQHHLQPFGLVNGGVFASIAETVASAAGAIVAGLPVAGINNNTHFFKSARSGVICAETTALHVGKSTHTWQVAMTQADRLLAQSSVQLMVLTGVN
ncbi:PaaI family thioesterase [Corynebacterium epidermidicanis]|uniref:Thioesterase domain-containing protein n=1 Tax=Corynebacterium epidermidicanis TaxID=1050174 RepID=A0A0G3GPE0_9CORY|nr:PaaI family thioesterase [Corynebacterium epidermidicanis]AKK03096.1 hypothetical protein CEPID_06180 [Corynebacterium epidermidicanis]